MSGCCYPIQFREKNAVLRYWHLNIEVRLPSSIVYFYDILSYMANNVQRPWLTCAPDSIDMHWHVVTAYPAKHAGQARMPVRLVTKSNHLYKFQKLISKHRHFQVTLTPGSLGGMALNII